MGWFLLRFLAWGASVESELESELKVGLDMELESELKLRLDMELESELKLGLDMELELELEGGLEPLSSPTYSTTWFSSEVSIFGTVCSVRV